MSTVLDRIVEQKKEDLVQQKKKVAAGDFRSFAGWEVQRKSLARALSNSGVDIIAELKKASPSKGVIREDFNIETIVAAYEQSGASALSILTEQRFFQGDPKYIEQLLGSTSLPILRKDFIVDFYQIEEARGIGADAVLLIATITSGNQLMELHHAATEAGLETLIECYDSTEFAQINFDQVKTVGINNRNLNTFEVDVHRGIEALHSLPEHVLTVSESGLSTPEDIELLQKEGIDAALIGEHFMKQPDPGEALKKLIYKPEHENS